MTYEVDRISYQSSEQAARAFHKKMVLNHYEIQALKAQNEKLVNGYHALAFAESDEVQKHARKMIKENDDERII